MAYCESCGELIGGGWAFCRRCGARIEQEPRSEGEWLGGLGESDLARGADQPTRRPARPRRRAIVASIATAVVLAGVAGTVLVLRDRRSSPVIALGAPSNSASTVTPSPSPTPDSSFASWFASESSGVIRIQATSCGQSDIGTGFLIAPDLVATVNHVVAAPVTVALSAGGETTTGVVVGSDPSGDLALVRAARPFAGHVFSLASSPPQVGAAVAAMGYPENLPLTMTQGAISGLDRTITLDGRSLGGLIQTDTPVNPGNSGGPLIDASGTVVGLVDAKLLQAEGIGYAISSGPA